MTDGALAQTWATRELPVLRSALRRIDAGEEFPNLESIREEVGLSSDQMRLSVEALANAWPPYLEVSWMGGGAGFIDAVTERTRRELGTWPTSASVIDGLVAALERAAENASEPEQGSRFRSIADGLSGFARDVAIGVVTNKLNGL